MELLAQCIPDSCMMNNKLTVARCDSTPDLCQHLHHYLRAAFGMKKNKINDTNKATGSCNEGLRS